MYIKTLTTCTLALGLLLTSTVSSNDLPGSKVGVMNALSTNGFQLNGWNLNGLELNGWNLNGLKTNELALNNGVRFSGFTLKEMAPLKRQHLLANLANKPLLK